MKKIISLVIVLFSLSMLSGCQQWMARTFGGNVTVNIPAGEQLVTMTWKETSLWLLTYNPATRACIFRENSAAGAMEGTVTVPNCNPIQIQGAMPDMAVPK